MKKQDVVLAVLVCILFSATPGRADTLERMDAKDARKMAKKLCRVARKIKHPQVKIVPDITKAEGVRRSDDVVIIFVPQQGLAERERSPMESVRTMTGAALGYLFTYQVVPVIDDESVEAEELRRLPLTTEDGVRVNVGCLLLTVRQLTEDDWRLYVYGVDRKPLIDARFAERKGPGRRPVAIECKNVDGFEGDLVVTVFDQYQARFKVRYQAD